MATARLPVRRRYTKGSIILTSNKSYGEWGSVFGDDVAAAAVIDGLAAFSCRGAKGRSASGGGLDRRSWQDDLRSAATRVHPRLRLP